MMTAASRSRSCALALLLLVAGLATGCEGRGAAPDAGTPDDLFAGAAVLDLHLTLDDEAVAALAADAREYVRGDLQVGGAVWRDVGVRLKGNRSRQSWDGKPAFKLHFGKFGKKKRRFFGLEKLALNNMVEDPTMLRETLAYGLHRAAGVPAPRTAYAQVFVNRRLFGLYLIVEPPDQGRKGSLYEGNYGCDLYPDDVAGFEQDGGKDETRADLAALAGAPDRLLAADGPLDLPRVLAYLAVSAYVGDFDGYRHGHNYRIHHDPESGRWTFLPWGLDRTFRKHLGIHDSGGLVAKRCFADAACRLAYARTMHQVVRLAAALPAELERTEALIDEAVRRDPRRPYGIQEVEKRRKQLRTYLERRPGKVGAAIACVDGERERELDRDGDGFGCLDVDDADPAVHPGAAEACNGKDDDGNGLVDDGPACPCPEVVVDGTAFALCDLPMTWAEADAFCAAQGHALARLDSVEQSRAVAAAAKAARKKKSKWWIGLSDRGEEDAFRWSDGAPADFTRWSKGEPDNDSCNQDCAALGDRGTGKWNDTHCASRLPFVCRKR